MEFVTPSVCVEESEYVHATNGIFDINVGYIIDYLTFPIKKIITYAGARVVEIHLYYSVKISILEHFVHDLVFCSFIYTVSNG